MIMLYWPKKQEAEQLLALANPKLCEHTTHLFICIKFAGNLTVRLGSDNKTNLVKVLP